MLLISFLMVVAPRCFNGHRLHTDRIPNGDNVPDPCLLNISRQNTQHVNPVKGGMAGNPFARDFYSNGKIWDSRLCNHDSDGDGRTNGVELGDPGCVWTRGKSPAFSSGLSHPGVCEPIESEWCIAKNKNLAELCDRKDEDSRCIEKIKNQRGSLSHRIAFPATPVPAVETTYMCQVFGVPNDTEYHIIASEPHIVNQQVVHHILVFGCSEVVAVVDKPEECGMIDQKCRDLLFAWAVGFKGECLNEAFGFRIGTTGYKQVLMQIHWTNHDLRKDYTDSSGMTLYYTPNMRENDGAMLITGQLYINIPGGEPDHTAHGTCSSKCTRVFPRSIYFTAAFIHMHYLGSSGYIKHYRNGIKVTDLVSQDTFQYHAPTFFRYDKPVEVQPGDDIRTICHYNSTGRNDTTYWGNATSDEMCLGFLTYYPKMEMTDCFAYKNESSCDNYTLEGNLVADCNYTSFDMNASSFFTKLAAFCDPTGLFCYPDCQDLLFVWSGREPCLAGEALHFTKSHIQKSHPEHADYIINQIKSCVQ